MARHPEGHHRAVKEKSMHHMKHHEAPRRKRGGRAHEDEFGGGDDTPEPDVETSYSGKSHVTEEAKGEVRKKGGRTVKDCRKAGGRAHHKKEERKEEHEAPKRRRKHVGALEGHEKRARLDRPGRKRGGGVGADSSPLTHAHRLSERRDGTRDDEERGITGE